MAKFHAGRFSAALSAVKALVANSRFGEGKIDHPTGNSVMVTLPLPTSSVKGSSAESSCVVITAREDGGEGGDWKTSCYLICGAAFDGVDQAMRIQAQIGLAADIQAILNTASVGA